MIGDCRRMLSQNAREWNLPEADNWKVVVSNNYQPNYSTLALFWFQGVVRFPNVVTKIFSIPEIPEREFASLQEVHRAVPSLVPRPLHVGQGSNDYWMLWMEGVPGWPFQAKKDSSSARLGSVVDALASIHQAVRRERAGSDRHRRLVTEPLNALTQFGDAKSVRAGCERLVGRCSEEWVDSLAVIPQHGDFFANNLLLYQDRWRLLDWESYGMIDLPFYDLFTFLTSLLRSGGEEPEFWNPSLAKQIPDLIHRYASGLGEGFPDVSLFLPLTLANWFHLQWVDGRRGFIDRMYRTIQHYFEHTDLWEEAFLRG